MAETPRSSFIPKQTPGTVSSRSRRKRRFHIVGFASSVILVASLGLGVGMYFYEGYANSQLQVQKDALAEQRTRFVESDILKVKEFDRRVSAAKLLLNNHISPSKIFDTLERQTKQRIQFVSFLLDQRESQNVTVEIEGGTEEFKTVALQALQFDSDDLLANALFTDISTQGVSVESLQDEEIAALLDEHSVMFTVIGDIPAEQLSYDGKPEAPIVVDQVIEDVEGEGEDADVTAEDILNE